MNSPNEPESMTCSAPLIEEEGSNSPHLHVALEYCAAPSPLPELFSAVIDMGPVTGGGGGGICDYACDCLLC